MTKRVAYILAWSGGCSFSMVESPVIRVTRRGVLIHRWRGDMPTWISEDDWCKTPEEAIAKFKYDHKRMLRRISDAVYNERRKMEAFRMYMKRKDRKITTSADLEMPF